MCVSGVCITVVCIRFCITERFSLCMCLSMCVCMSIYGGDDDRQIGGRCIIDSCPVTSITTLLASTSPFCSALKRGPSDILFVDPYADIVDQKWYASKKSRFTDHTSVCIKQAH